MKTLRYSVAIIAAFTGLLAFTSCHKQADAPMQNQIIGKWMMDAAIADHTDYGVNESDTTLFTNSDYFDFKTDGTVSIMATNVAYTGNWKITGDTLVFTNTGYVDFPGGFTVLSLTGSALKINHAQSNPPDHYLNAKLNFKR